VRASIVIAHSHRSCDLLLKATRGVTIAVVSSRERKRRQPGLATDDPAFVGWHQLVRGIQGSSYVLAVLNEMTGRSGFLGKKRPNDLGLGRGLLSIR
jgi:hypothetical protein